MDRAGRGPEILVTPMSQALRFFVPYEGEIAFLKFQSGGHVVLNFIVKICLYNMKET